MGRRVRGSPPRALADAASAHRSTTDRAIEDDALAERRLLDVTAGDEARALPDRNAAPAARARQALGARAEAAVAAYLVAQGMEILARNARVGRLEIDVIAREGDVIAVIEVRTRGAGSYVRALDSIDAGKRARVRRAGERLWRARFSKMRGVERMRFDAASVTFSPSGEPLVEHVKAAF